MSYDSHTEAAQQRDTPIRCAVITVSDTRAADEDTSGALMQERLTEAGHNIVDYRIVPDEPDVIRSTVADLASDAEAILFNGGTGLSARDRTYDALAGLLDKELPGFGELFRMLSYEEIGAGAMLSRATAGVHRGTLIFSTPGSTNAVKLAMDRLILPELKHLVWEVVRQRDRA